MTPFWHVLCCQTYLEMWVDWDLSKEVPMSAKVVTFRGPSGKVYRFHAISPDLNLKDVGAVYALTRRTQDHDGREFYSIIYLGQTENLGKAIAHHRQELWMLAHDVNCVCVHLEQDEDKRIQKVADLSASIMVPL